MADFYLLAPLVMGAIVGFIELIIVHQDESGMGWLAHGLHAIPITVVLLFVSFNTSYVLGLIGMKDNAIIDIGVRVLMGLIAAIKVKSAAAIVGKAGITMTHAIIIGVLIIAAPYAWELFLGALFAKWLPFQ